MGHGLPRRAEEAALQAGCDFGRTQRPDGSWPIRTVAGVVQDHGIDSNFCAYIAVGVWHHYLITRDRDFLERMWPTVWKAIELVLRCGTGCKLPEPIRQAHRAASLAGSA